MTVDRPLKPDYLQRMKVDFAFLLGRLESYNGELDIALRGTYFNIYRTFASLSVLL